MGKIDAFCVFGFGLSLLGGTGDFCFSRRRGSETAEWRGRGRKGEMSGADFHIREVLKWRSFCNILWGKQFLPPPSCSDCLHVVLYTTEWHCYSIMYKTCVIVWGKLFKQHLNSFNLLIQRLHIINIFICFLFIVYSIHFPANYFHKLCIMLFIHMSKHLAPVEIVCYSF